MKKPILGRQPFNLNATTESRSEKPLYTGRFLVIFDKKDDYRNVHSVLQSKAGLTIAHTSDFTYEEFDESKIEGADALIYDELGIALVGGVNEQIRVLEASRADYIVEPEKIVYVPEELHIAADTATTWGIDMMQVLESAYTGKGIKVAVLDTGFDVKHPDFAGRSITTNSFVPGESVDDAHGHGTHCIGSACGNVDVAGQRYGVAKDAEIFAGKVLSNEGSGAQAWILNGITWAANSGCKVISMSLGSPTLPGQSYDAAYERAAQFALSKGTVIVAAAGNESQRSRNRFNPVGSPADCPSILAVAALDASLNVADFSNRGINPTAAVDIAGPGVNVYSSWPMPERYLSISGTSMATPHVAGALALLWEKNPGATAQEIIAELTTNVRVLSLPAMDVGSGLVQAPLEQLV